LLLLSCITVRIAGQPTMFLKRILYYLNPVTLFKPSDPNLNLRFMHGINRISILMFLACIVVMVVRACTR
jgi:hypothetical protein